MNKKEFVSEISSKTNMTKVDSQKAVEAILDTISEALVNKESVAFTGFGTFTTANREQKTGRNPSTGKEMIIPATTVAKFKVGKSLKEAVAK